MAEHLTPDTVLTCGQMRMPIVGLGSWQATPDEIEDAVTTAVECGYRHIDTATQYENEKAIGDVLKKLINENKLKREDVFITTKLPLCGNRAEHVPVYLQRSLDLLQMDYVDLYLIHYPVGFKNHGINEMYPRGEDGKLDIDMTTDLVSIWKAMEAQVKAGKTKSIGLSNFNENQIQRILDCSEIPPSNLQVEMHVYFQQPELLKFCKEKGVSICAYAPIGSPGFTAYRKQHRISPKGFIHSSPLTDPVVITIAKNHNKTPAQVLLRYLMQCGVAVIPKSINPQRIKENFDVFDFELTDEECNQLKTLDLGNKGRIFSLGEMYREVSLHPESPFKLLSEC